MSSSNINHNFIIDEEDEIKYIKELDSKLLDPNFLNQI